MEWDETKSAVGCALEWLERLQPYYVDEATTTDRDREKLQQVIDWLQAIEDHHCRAEALANGLVKIEPQSTPLLDALNKHAQRKEGAR